MLQVTFSYLKKRFWYIISNLFFLFLLLKTFVLKPQIFILLFIELQFFCVYYCKISIFHFKIPALSWLLSSPQVFEF